MGSRFTVTQKLGEKNQNTQQGKRFTVTQKLNTNDPVVAANAEFNQMFNGSSTAARMQGFDKKYAEKQKRFEVVQKAKTNEIVTATNKDFGQMFNGSPNATRTQGFKNYIEGSPFPSVNPVPSIAQQREMAENYAKSATKGDGYEKYSLDELKKMFEKEDELYNGKSGVQGYKGNFVTNTLDFLGNEKAWQNQQQAVANYKALKAAYENRRAAYTDYKAAEKYGASNTEEALKLLEKKKSSANSKTEKEQIIQEIKELRKEYYGEGSIIGAIKQGADSGAKRVLSSVSKTGNFLLGAIPRVFGYENNIFSQTRDYYDNLHQESQREQERISKAAGDKHNISGQIAEGVTAALPDALMSIATAYLTGGTSAAAQLGEKGVGIVAAFGESVKGMAKNPFYWSSFTQTLGSDYEDAKAAGADEATATLYALLTSTLNAVVEVGGETGSAGIQSLPEALKNAAGNKKKIFEWVKSSASEGKEEMVQGVISQLNAAILYDKGKAIYSNTDEDAIFNLNRMAKEGAMGAAVGAILGGGQMTIETITNARTESQFKEIGKAAVENGMAVDAVEYAASSVDPQIRAIAIQVKNNPDIQSIGKLYSYTCNDVWGQINSAEDINVAAENYNTILEKHGDSKSITAMASDCFINKLLESGVDEETAELTKNEYIANVQNFRKNNLDNETGREYNYGRGEQNELSDKRTAYGNNGERQGGQQNARANSENGRAWQEDQGDFIQRTERLSPKTGGGKRVLLKHGNAVLAYAERSSDNTRGSVAAQKLKNIGVDAVYCDGDIETNQNGKTVRHSEALTTPDGKVFISSNAALSPEHIAYHENVHVNDRLQTQHYEDYESVLCGNLLYNSKSFEDICGQINDNQYGGKYDVGDPDNAKVFVQEIAAYVNEYVMTDPEYAEQTFGPMFEDWNDVTEAVHKFNTDTKADFSQSASFYAENGESVFSEPSARNPKYDIIEDIKNEENSIDFGKNRNLRNELSSDSTVSQNEQSVNTDISKSTESDTQKHSISDENFENKEIQRDVLIQNDSYAKDASFWTAKNANEKSKKAETLANKLKALFGNDKENSVVSVSEIVKLIEKDFGVPISKGKFRQKAYGIYKVKSEAIRTKISNALPTIGHELGHHLDKKYGLRNFQSTDEAMRVLKKARPDFYNAYSPQARPGEAVAEFIRNYLADRTLAKRSYPFFYEEFERVLSQSGNEDLKNLKTIGDKVNEYFTAEKVERARAAVISYEEAKRRNKEEKNLTDYLEKFETDFIDEAAPLKKISQKAYDLFYYAKKTDVRTHEAIVGSGVASFDGENGGIAYMRDVDGNVVKDSNGNFVNMQPLKNVLSDISQESMPNFEMYLVYKHGLEFLEQDKRVFADDTINDKAFLADRIKYLEKSNPHFKKTADALYSWYKSFVYEYGVKSGLLTKEQYKMLNEKYPCYVPFNRNVDGKTKGTKRGFANQSAPIMRAKGSGIDILNPIETMLQKVSQFMTAADRNAVMQDIANKADNVEGLGYLLEQVPPDMVPVTVSTETLKKNIKEWYKGLSEAGTIPYDFNDSIDEIIGDTVTQFVQSNNQGKNVVWVYRKGKKTLYQVHDPNLLTALTGLNKPQFGKFTRAIGNVTRLFKVLTTGGNFVWSISSNAPRDFDAAYKYSTEKNPFKFTLDYIRAVKSAFSQVREGKADDVIKLYKTVGGGYNNSLIYNSKELKTTMSELIKSDDGYLKRFISHINFIDGIEQLADFIETAPRLSEFKRVYEKTGDTQKALLAAEEITVNFNRSGAKSKKIDQYIPYFNASIQGVNKLASTVFDSEKNKAFIAKTIVSGIIKTGLIFTWNILAAGDDDNDEYEKLSAYKKNNFYNLYIGNGKFLSIPKSKDTAVFDSLVERVFETALKEDADYNQEVKDFLSYLWLTFAPPLPTDAVILTTVKDLWKNEDFKGSPIVSSYYEKLTPREQYNEKTTYIAKALGRFAGYSPMKIDHIINSNLGIIGLLNKSLGTKDKDFTLGIKNKLIADNAYSSDVLNRFYDNADEYEKMALSYPDDVKAVYKNKQYSAARSIISTLNRYADENPDNAREIKILARDYADNFEKNSNIDEELLKLMERTNDNDILYDKTFSREYSFNKVKYTMDLEDYLNYVDEYYDEVEKEYDRILSMNVSDEYTVKMLKNAKKEVSDRLKDKYKK